MTVTADAGTIVRQPEEHGGAPVAQALALANRSVLASFRQFGLVLFPFIFPLFFAALSTSSFNRATNLPGFPEVDSFLDFLLPATITQGVMFGAIQAGVWLATDIQTGFFERLLSSPVWRVAILLGRLAGAAVIAALQAVIFSLVLMAFGARIHAGVGGFAALIVYAVFVAVAVGGLMCAVAIRSGSTEVVNGAFPLIFVAIWPSSAFFPTSLMDGWFAEVATHNPITWMIDAMRHLTIDGWSWRYAGQGIGIAVALAAAGVLYSLVSLRRRLAAA